MSSPFTKSASRAGGLLLLSVVAAIVAFLGVEIAYRALTAITDGEAFFHQTNRWIEDPDLGWVTAPDIDIRSMEKDGLGNAHEVEYRTNALGMRTFSSKDARCRILVLGDSFTDAIEVSNDQTFHSIMDERSSCAVFAYGVGGWGNLQEMMALEKLVPVTSPSEVIVQLSGNDIINNSFELEQQSYWNNLAQRRPYLGEDGVIRQRTPYNTPLVSWLRFVPSWVEDNFRIMSFVKYRLLRYAASHHGDDTIEARLMRNREDVPAYQAALAITRQIFDRMTALAPNADFLAFAATTGPMAEDLLAVAKSSGMTIVGGLPEAVEQADKAGTPVYSSDGVHWSVTGHQLVADFLLQRLDAKRIDPLVSLDCETRVDLDSVSP